MTRTHVAVLLIGLPLLAGFLTVAGCAPVQSPAELCSALTNCPGLSLTQEEKNEVLQVCPQGLALLQIYSPDCYDCVADNTCSTPDACLQRCGSLINQVLPGTVP
jgi:hypothetical protein